MVRLNLCGSEYDGADPVGRLCFHEIGKGRNGGRRWSS